MFRLKDEGGLADAAHWKERTRSGLKQHGFRVDVYCSCLRQLLEKENAVSVGDLDFVSCTEVIDSCLSLSIVL